MSMTELLLAPFVGCLILTGIHCYLGLTVVSRGIIFVDLALAQLAALGGAVALLAGIEHGATAYGFSLLFTILGAAAFALTRLRSRNIPQEAMIGIIYAVASAGAILILDRAPHGREAIESMLVGSILFVDWPTIGRTALLYTAIGAVHVVWRRRFAIAKLTSHEAAARGVSAREVLAWDFLFYATFGVVVTSSVQMAGVLLVFSFLVIPAVCAILFVRTARGRLIFGWIFSSAVSAIGLYASASFDLPSGAAVVATFGVAWLLAMGVAGLVGVQGATAAAPEQADPQPDPTS